MNESKVQTSYKKLYVKEHVRKLRHYEYERLFNHPQKYRVIFSDDDYDYIEDKYLIRELDALFDA